MGQITDHLLLTVWHCVCLISVILILFSFPVTAFQWFERLSLGLMHPPSLLRKNLVLLPLSSMGLMFTRYNHIRFRVMSSMTTLASNFFHVLCFSTLYGKKKILYVTIHYKSPVKSAPISYKNIILIYQTHRKARCFLYSLVVRY